MIDYILKFVQKTLFFLKNKIKAPEYTKFTVVSVFIGAVVGFAAVFFHKSIDFFNHIFFNQTANGLYFLGAAAVIALPAIGMLIQAIMIKIAPDITKQSGIPEIIKIVAIKGGKIPFLSTFFHFIAPVISIGSGNTVGPEGPAARLGGGVANKLGTLIGLSDSRRRVFTAAGAGAAIAAIFNSPLGGIFFALEIILLNNFQSSTFSALILSSVTASSISRIFLGDESVFRFGFPFVGSYKYLHLYAIMGVLVGLLALSFIKYSISIESLFKKKLLKILPQWTLMLSIGLIVGVCGFFYKDIFGIGYEGINNVLSLNLPIKVVIILFLMKFLLVPLILNSGGFGGVFAPSLFMGACFGFVYSQVLIHVWDLPIDPVTFILVGMGAMLGGINSIPISAILIIFEMTKDYSFILPLMLAVVISTMIVQISFKGTLHTRHLELQGFHINRNNERSTLQSVRVESIINKAYILLDENTRLPMLLEIMVKTPNDTYFLKDNQGKISGVITSGLMRPILTEYENVKNIMIAGDIAIKDIITVTPNDSLDYVMKLFEKKDYDQIPVVESINSNKIIGIIDKRDVIATYNKENLKQNLSDGFVQELKTINKTEKSKIADGYSILLTNPAKDFIGKSLSHLKIRNRFGLEILMIKKRKDPYSDKIEEEIIQPSGNYIIEKEDQLYLFGKDEMLEICEKWD